MWKDLKKKKKKKDKWSGEQFLLQAMLKKMTFNTNERMNSLLVAFKKKTLYLLMKRVIHKGEKPNQLIVFLNKVSNAWSY